MSVLIENGSKYLVKLGDYLKPNYDILAKRLHKQNQTQMKPSTRITMNFKEDQTAITVQQTANVSEHLSARENESFLLCLIYAFIAKNDAEALRAVLGDIEKIPRLFVFTDELDDFEELYGSSGIYRDANVLDTIRKSYNKRNRLGSQDSDVMKNYNSTSGYINILKLACLLKMYFRSTNVISVLLEHTPVLDKHTLRQIITDQGIDQDTVCLILKTEHLANDNTHFPDGPLYLQYYEALKVLVHFCLNTGSAITDTQRRSKALTKLQAILNTPFKIRVSKTSSLAQSLDPYRDILRLCMNQALEKKDSAVFRCFLDARIDHLSDVLLKQFLLGAVKYRAYFILHLLISNGSHGFFRTFQFNLNDVVLDKQFDIYLLFYLLQRDRICSYPFHCVPITEKNVFALCLLGCFNFDLKSFPVLSHLIDSIDDINVLLAVMDIFIKLGADVDEHMSTSTPLVTAAWKGNLRIMRLLIYHSCDINPRITYAKLAMAYQHQSHYNALGIEMLRRSNYAALRILLPCGVTIPHAAVCRELSDHEVTKGGTSGGTVSGTNDRASGKVAKIPGATRWVMNWFQKPPSLKFHCRKVLREQYGKKLGPCLDQLQYPWFLKDYLRTKYLD